MKLEWNNKEILSRWGIDKDFMITFIICRSIVTLYIKAFWFFLVEKKFCKNSAKLSLNYSFSKVFLSKIERNDSSLLLLNPSCFRIGKFIQYMSRLSAQIFEYPIFEKIFMTFLIILLLSSFTNYTILLISGLCSGDLFS